MCQPVPRKPAPRLLARVFILLSLIFLLGVAMAVGGCSKSAESQGAGQPGGPGAGPGAQTPIPVAVSPADTGSIASFYNATASLEAEKQAQVLARVSGVVGRLAAEEGDLVDEGAVLLTIDNDEYRFRLQQAEATTGNLRARYQRFEAMLAEQLTTEEEYQAARSDLANAEAEEGLARLNLSYTQVRAPFRGRVTSRLVDPGQNVSAGTELMVMADFDPLLARVHVPSRQFNKLSLDQTVDLVLDSSGQVLRGRIKLISPVIDPTSGTIKVTVEVPDYPADTRPGDFAEVRIVTERRTGTILVPLGAVINEKGEQVVYVVADKASGQGQGQGNNQGKPQGESKPRGEHAAQGQDNSGAQRPAGPVARRKVVTVGFTDDDHAEILTGLSRGDRVVVRGQRSLKNGSPLKILDGEGS